MFALSHEVAMTASSLTQQPFSSYLHHPRVPRLVKACESSPSHQRDFDLASLVSAKREMGRGREDCLKCGEGDERRERSRHLAAKQVVAFCGPGHAFLRCSQLRCQAIASEVHWLRDMHIFAPISKISGTARTLLCLGILYTRVTICQSPSWVYRKCFLVGSKGESIKQNRLA